MERMPFSKSALALSAITLAGRMSVLTLKGEVKQSEEVKEKAYHIHEQRWGAFERTLILPANVIADNFAWLL